MTTKSQRYTVQQVLDAIAVGHTGAGAARVLGCVASTVRNYALRYPTVAKALDGEREDIVDYAELGLRKAVLDGEAWAVAFALKTLGKKRGYVERTEIREVTSGDVDAAIETELARLADKRKAGDAGTATRADDGG